MKFTKNIQRREFLSFSQKAFVGCTASMCMGTALGSRHSNATEARYYVQREDNIIQCQLCPWQCVVRPGKRGACEVRENRNGKYYSLVYGQIAAHHVDPIEKKPLYHFKPQTMAFSVATAGCNVECKFCQNWELAQRRPEELRSVFFTPSELIQYAKHSGSQSIAYTYNEPTIFAEFILDTATESQGQGISNVIISNGFIAQKPLRDLCKVIDAYKVDLKAFTESYYHEIVGGRLRPVLDTLVTLREEEVWSEIVYLILPGMNDSDEELKKLSRWIYQELGADIPLHFSRFYPKYKLKNLPPTPIKTLEKARQIALDAGLQYVYMGNVPGHEGENTYCPNCKEMLVQRVGYKIYKNNIQNGQCQNCHHQIPGVWQV